MRKRARTLARTTAGFFPAVTAIGFCRLKERIKSVSKNPNLLKFSLVTVITLCDTRKTRLAPEEPICSSWQRWCVPAAPLSQGHAKCQSLLLGFTPSFSKAGRELCVIPFWVMKDWKSSARLCWLTGLKMKRFHFRSSTLHTWLQSCLTSIYILFVGKRNVLIVALKAVKCTTGIIMF